MAATRMTCSECGMEMNHHADKLDWSEPESADPELAGVIQEAHTCPGCGKSATRRA
jgi:ribosomal protein S27AE